MQIARIADLLAPFVSAPISAPGPPPPDPRHATSSNSELSTPRNSEPPASCHSEPAKAGEEPAVPFAVPSTVLSPAQLQDISTYIDILVRWNARINLTAIRDPEDIVTRHFGESLFAARLLTADTSHVGTAALGCPPERSSAALSVADVGSGAGFPGLPIKLWAPHIFLTLIESNHKKVAFLREVTRALILTNVDIQNTRAESLSSVFDVVTLRAVENFTAILPTAAALLAPSGRLALLISFAQQAQARESLPHLTWSSPTPIPLSRSRILLIAHRSE